MRVPYAFSRTRNWGFYFFVILGINLFYVRVNSNFGFVVNMKSCFKFSVMREKAKQFCVILLSERV